MSDNFIPHKLSLRLGNINDYEGVMNINREVYQSFDYLSSMFHQLAQDKNHYMFIAEYDGNIVGYIARYFLQGDQHCLALSARTHPEYQRHGISEKLRKYANDYLLNTHGDFAKRSTTMWTSKKEERTNTNKSVSKYFIHHLSAYEVNVESVRTKLCILEEQVDLSVAEKLSLNELRHYMMTDGSVRNLSKYNPYVVIEGGFHYDITKTNLKLMALKYNSYITRDKRGNSCQAMSCMSIHRMLDGIIKYDIFYTGHPSFDIWAAHAVQHIIYALKIMPEEKWRVMIHTPGNMDVENIHQFLKPIFGNRLKNDLYDTTKVIAAQEYPTSIKSRI